MSLRLATFAWTGNATDNRDIPGGSDFTTTFAFTRNNGTNSGAMSWIGLGDDQSFRPGISQGTVANYIQLAVADPNTDGGIEVGSTNFVNQNTQPFTGVGMTGDSAHYFEGSYTGTGANQTIAGVGFQPDLIIVKRTNGTTIGCYRIRSMPDTKSSLWANAALSTTNILRETSDGFDLGSGANANLSGATFGFIAIKIPSGQGDVGNYAGNSTDNTDITLASGITPRLVMVQADATEYGIFRTDQHAANNSSPWAESQANVTDGIKSFASGSFRLGTNAKANATGNNYYYLALTDTIASTLIKTISGLAKASVKTLEGTAIASVKTVQGLT